MARDPSVNRTVLSVRGSRTEFVSDVMVRETHLRIVAGGDLLAVLACTPLDLEDLVAGFLFGQGLIDGPGDLARLDLSGDDEATSGSACIARVVFQDPERGKRAYANLAAMKFVASGCGAAPTQGPAAGQRNGGDQLWDRDPSAYPPREGGAPVAITPGTVEELARAIQRCSPLFHATGGVHAAALSGPLPHPGGLLAVREDIGRHNAVDKIAGHCIRTGIDPADKALLVTGRVSVEIVAKADRLGCRVVVSRSAPTDLAVEVADASGITLVGFARGERANVYSHWWRLS